MLVQKPAPDVQGSEKGGDANPRIGVDSDRPELLVIALFDVIEVVNDSKLPPNTHERAYDLIYKERRNAQRIGRIQFYLKEEKSESEKGAQKTAS